MPISERENYLRTLEFRNPEWIPMLIDFAPAVWKKNREDLEELVLRHPIVFGSHEKGSVDFDEFASSHGGSEYYTDEWGCVWHNLEEGMIGQVIEHPLSCWENLKEYQPPDPLLNGDTMFGKRDWEAIAKTLKTRKQRGELTEGLGDCLFDRLYYLRGFENLMVDIASDSPQLPELIEMLTDYEMKLVGKWLELGVDMIGFHTDIGSQKALMISPEKFRKYIKPMFKKIFGTCREAGTHVYVSSDGYLLEIVDDLVACGVSMHDPQLRANTLKGIRQAYKGKMCIKLDLDEQMFPFCRPADIRKQIEEVVIQLGSPLGGLMLWGCITPDVPLGNIEAIVSGMEEFCTYWWNSRG